MTFATLVWLLLLLDLAVSFRLPPRGSFSNSIRLRISVSDRTEDNSRSSYSCEDQQFAMRLHRRFVNSIASFERRALRELLLRSLLISGSYLGVTTEAKATGRPPGTTTTNPQTSVLKKTPNALPPQQNQVVASKLDDRRYRAMTLGNGLRVLLISDPKAVVAAAALDVHVGSFSDPTELPGLAHFCEHMSFLGTKKYPGEEEFSSFLSAHGGASNAYTDSEDTVYYFDVNAESLPGGLDRFSQFFVAPLFTASATSRELNAIESEHAKNINSDSFRIYQLTRDSANPIHPLNKFATGNKFTLETNAIANGVDSRQLLLEFHRKYYSAGLMTLSVLGKDSLDDLQALVARCFDEVPNNNQKDPSISWVGVVPPYLPQSAASLLEVVPITQSRSITLSWPLWIRTSDERRELLRSKPAVVLSHLLGHEGTGSLRSYLSRKGWINSIQAYNSNDITDMQSFDVSVDLTEDGFTHRYEVVSSIFAYLDLISKQRQSGRRAIPNYIVDELQTLSHIAFDYAEKPDPSSYVTRLVSSMQDYMDPSLYLTGPQFFTPPDQEQIFAYLDQLRPAAVKITVCSPDLKGKTDKIGQYYGTEYSNSTLSSQTLQWSTVRADDYPELKLPRPNIFIPAHFDLISGSTRSNVDSTSEEEEQKRLLQAPPVLIRNDDRWELWHKLDESFKQPKIYAIISLAVAAQIYNPHFIMNAKLFISCFLDSINEFLYEAGLAGLQLNIEVNSKGIVLVVSGFSDKVSLFAEQVCKYLTAFIPNEETYARFKGLIDRELMNWSTEQPYYHSSYYASLASESLQYPIDEIKLALKAASIKQLDGFLKSTLQKSYGKALVIGNIDRTGAMKLTEIVQSVFAFNPLPAAERSIKQVALVPLSSSIQAATGQRKSKGFRIARPEPNLNDGNSATTFYFQIPSLSPDDYMCAELLAEVLEQPFYNSLRTKQQLGYIVYSGLKVREQIRYLAFVAQSSIVDGRELTTRVEQFLRADLPDILRSLTSKEFEVFKSGISVKKLEPDQRLTSQANRFWTEIIVNDSPLKTPVFDRAEKEVHSLAAITLDRFRRFAEDLLSTEGRTRRLLVSEISTSKATAVLGRQSGAGTSSSSPPSDYTEVVDEVAFRQQCGYI